MMEGLCGEEVSRLEVEPRLALAPLSDLAHAVPAVGGPCTAHAPVR